MGGILGDEKGLMAFTLISMEKFALSYKQIEVRARSRNELNSCVKIPLYYRKKLLRVVVDYAPGICSPSLD